MAYLRNSLKFFKNSCGKKGIKVGCFVKCDANNSIVFKKLVLSFARK